MGIYEFSPIEEHFHKQFNTNVHGALLTTQAAMRHPGEGASIVNIKFGRRPHYTFGKCGL